MIYRPLYYDQPCPRCGKQSLVVNRYHRTCEDCAPPHIHAACADCNLQWCVKTHEDEI